MSDKNTEDEDNHKINFIIYINLEESRNRDIWMRELLLHINIPYFRFAGIKPQYRDFEENDKYHTFLDRSVKYIKHGFKQKHHNIIGILGLYITAYSILKKYQNINKNFLILEDDVDFEPDVIDKVNTFIEDHTDFDLIRVVWTNDSKKNKYIDTINKSPKLQKTWNMCHKLTVKNYENGFMKITTPFFRSRFDKGITGVKPHCFLGGSHFTVINGKNIHKIINYMDNENVYELDGIYSTNQLNVYCLDLPVYINVAFDSTIEKDGYTLLAKKKYNKK